MTVYLTPTLYGPTPNAEYEPPNGSTYVDPTAGHDQLGDGTITQPYRTVARSLTDPRTHTVVHRAGDYHESVGQPWLRPITMQPAPGERARYIGSSIRTDWTQDQASGLWWTPAPLFGHAPNSPLIVDPGRFWSCWPEGLWMDGTAMEMSDPRLRPGPGQFVVSTGRLIISDNPNDHTMRVADLGRAITGSQDPTNGNHPILNLHGLDICQYATASMERAAVTVFGAYSRITGCSFVDCSAAGVSLRNDHITVDHCAMVGNGQLGVHAYRAGYLTLAHLDLIRNNTRGYRTDQEAGAAKWVQSVHVLARSCRLIDNYGHGLWADVGSDDAAYVRIVATGGNSGVFFEMSDRAIITGCSIWSATFGILASASGSVTVMHNRVAECPTPILVRSNDQRRPPEQQAGHTILGNDTDRDPLNMQPPATPTLAAAALLDLPLGHVAEPHQGWYGPTNQQETILSVSTDLTTAANAAVAWITTLETDLGTAQAAQAAAVAAQAAAEAALATSQAALATAQAQVTADQATIASLTAARDAAIAQGAATLDQLNAANAALATVQAQLATTTATLATRTTERDGYAANLWTCAVTSNTRTAERDAARAALAACCPPAPPVIWGGSDKNGYPDLKTQIAPVIPGCFRQFVSGATASTADLDKTAVVVADNAVPVLSWTQPTTVKVNTQANVDALIARGWGNKLMGYCAVHEPTQKMTPTAFKAMLAAEYPIVRGYLPNARRLIIVQRYDFIAPTADGRHPSLYWPTDPTLVTTLGVDVYDSANTAQSFQSLMVEAEAFARSKGVKIWIPEFGCPDVGQLGRPVGYKAGWLAAAQAYMDAHRDLYELAAYFNSDLGQNAPPAAGNIPAGYWAWSTPEALAEYKRDVELGNPS